MRLAPLAALFASALSGCSLMPLPPTWYSQSMLDELRTQEEYSNFISARYAGLVGDAPAAARYYGRAYANAPGDSGLLERATIATLAAGDIEAAVKLSKSAKATVAEDAPSAQLALMIDDIKSGRLVSAQTRLRKPVLGAFNGDLAGFLSAWLTAVEDPAKAVAEIDAFQGRRMIVGEQASLTAIIQMMAEQDAEAAESFRVAMRVQLSSRDIVASLGARMLASRGDLQGARDLIALSAMDGEPGPGAARTLKDIETGKFIARPRLTASEGAALTVFIVSGNGLVRSSPDLSTMRHAMALYLDPGSEVTRLVLAEAYDRQDRAEDAIAMLRTVPDESPWAGDARMEEAGILNRLERRTEALAAGERALSVSKRRDVMLQLGDLYRVNGRGDAAGQLYNEVIAADAARGVTDWRVLFARATVRSDTGDWKDAETDLQTALAIEPDRPELLNYLGFGWVDRGERLQEGLALIQQAADARPDQGYIIDSLGWAYLKLGQTEKALEHLERAAELSPTDPEVADHLGDAYWKAGRQTEARFAWTRALSLKPDAARDAGLRRKLDGGLPVTPGGSLASRP